MTLAEFDARMEHADRTRAQGLMLLDDSSKDRLDTLREAGLTADVVGQMWRHKDLPGLFKSPREALEAAWGK